MTEQHPDPSVAEARMWCLFYEGMWRALIEGADPPPPPDTDPPYWLTRTAWIPDLDVARDRHRAAVRMHRDRAGQG